jgi:protein subunit release factor B
MSDMDQHVRRLMGPIIVSSDRQILVRMKKIGLREDDIEEKFIRSGGHGGQNVNKVSSCVMLTHRPTGATVKCQVSRHQGMNRSIARRILLDKLEKGLLDQQKAVQEAEEKALRQSRKPSRSARARNVAEKRQQAVRRSAREVKFED